LMIAEQKDNNQEIRDSKVVFGFQYWHTWNSAQPSLSGLASREVGGLLFPCLQCSSK
jgi:hypothetical protein